jgi:iron complex outermembrane recepter protein
MKLAHTFALTVILSALALASATAQERDAQAMAIDIPAQPLGEALTELGKQIGLQVVLYASAGKQTTTTRLTGTFTPQAALERLLAHTGLRYEYLDSNTVAVFDESTALPSASGAQLASRVRLATAEAAQGTSPVDGADAQNPSPDAGENASVLLEEVVVTGSHIARPPSDGALDVRVYSAQQIARSGRTTVADFINTLPSVSIAVQEQANVQHPGGGTTVRLRGLPVGTTLLLIDGRRVETSGTQSGSNFFDLNNIPLAAIERIEVLASGASAIDGSDASAGVVNLRLK